MQITKHVHACLSIADHGQTLVVDPGSFTPAFEARHLVGIVVTHEHADHWTPEHLARLLAAAPDATVFAPPGAAAAIEAASTGVAVDTVRPGDERTVGGFRLRFFGGTHAEIHTSIPLVDNVGVLVDEALYYPGDSFALPGTPVELLATPCGAPWLKVGEVMDFVLALSPRRTFATHEQTLSEAGRQLANARIGWAVEQGGGEHHLVEPGDVLEV